jgi:hypothetical protein
MKRYLISLIFFTILSMTTISANNFKRGIHSVFGNYGKHVHNSNSIRDQVVPFSKTNLTLECNDKNYHDCYNCTLANCNWDVGGG